MKAFLRRLVRLLRLLPPPPGELVVDPVRLAQSTVAPPARRIVLGTSRLLVLPR